MTFVALFGTATKLAGVIVTITITANALSFSRFKRKNLRPFRSPIDESSDVLAVFNVDEEQKPYVDSQVVKQQADALMGSAGDGGSHQAASSRQHDDYAVKKRKKTLKVAMEAMIRGFEKYSEEDEEEAPAAVPKEEHQHNVTAWQNVPHREERLRFWSDPDTELKLAILVSLCLSYGYRLVKNNAEGACKWAKESVSLTMVLHAD